MHAATKEFKGVCKEKPPPLFSSKQGTRKKMGRDFIIIIIEKRS